MNTDNDKDFGAVLMSGLFTFIVSKSRTPITVHTEIFAKISDPLSAMMKGSMEEAQLGRAVFEELDVQTFVYACEFAYSGGYYIVPLSKELKQVLSGSKDLETRKRTADQEPYSESLKEKALKLKRPRMSNGLAESPDGSMIIHSASASNVAGSPDEYEAPPTPWGKIDEDLASPSNKIEETVHSIGKTLIAHLEVYIFADMYGIVGLTELSYNYIDEILEDWEPEETTVEEVIEFVRKVYGASSEDLVEIPRLASLVAEHLTIVMPQLMQLRVFREFLEEGGKVVTQIIQRAMVTGAWK